MWRSEDNMWESVLFQSQVGARIEVRLSGLLTHAIIPLSHLAGLASFERHFLLDLEFTGSARLSALYLPASASPVLVL